MAQLIQVNTEAHTREIVNLPPPFTTHGKMQSMKYWREKFNNQPLKADHITYIIDDIHDYSNRVNKEDY